MFVQDSTAEDSDAYSDTTQVVPESEEDAATAVEAKEVGSGDWVVSGRSIEDGTEAGRVVFTSVVEGLAEGPLDRTEDTLEIGRGVLVTTWLVEVAPD